MFASTALEYLAETIAFILDLVFLVSPLHEVDAPILPEAIRKSPLFVPYEPLVLSVRAVEGMLIGALVRRHHPIVFFTVIAVFLVSVAIAYPRIPAGALLGIRLSWVVVGGIPPL